MPVCTRYKEWRPRTAFGREPRNKSGHSSWCKPCYRAYSAEKRKCPAHLRHLRDQHLKRKYGITIQDYELMLRSQGGACGICGSETPRGLRYFAVDHCHKTGRVRGLLCQICNKALGHLGDCSEGVKRALEYLERSEGMPGLALDS